MHQTFFFGNKIGSYSIPGGYGSFTTIVKKESLYLFSPLQKRFSIGNYSGNWDNLAGDKMYLFL